MKRQIKGKGLKGLSKDAGKISQETQKGWKKKDVKIQLEIWKLSKGANRKKEENSENLIEKEGKGILRRGFEGVEKKRNVFNEDGKTWFHTNESVCVSPFLCLFTFLSCSNGASRHLVGREKENEAVGEWKNA
jgi:hypothetical protein